MKKVISIGKRFIVIENNPDEKLSEIFNAARSNVHTELEQLMGIYTEYYANKEKKQAVNEAARDGAASLLNKYYSTLKDSTKKIVVTFKEPMIKVLEYNSPDRSLFKIELTLKSTQEFDLIDVMGSRLLIAAAGSMSENGYIEPFLIELTDDMYFANYKTQ